MASRSCSKVGLWVAVAGAVFAQSARAEEDRFELSPEQLFTATVMSVSKTSERLMDAPAAVYVLSNEDIKRSGATSIAEALRLVPGVQVARTHAGGWAISVRGFNSALANKLLVLIDGREVYDPLFSGVYWDVQDTALEDIERIEVIRGPGATLWGANAVNGVINILTKSAEDTQGGMVTALAGNQDRVISTARYGGKAGDAHYRAYVKYLDRDEERALSGIGAHDPQQKYHGGFRSDWKSGDDDRFTLQGDAYRGDVRQMRVTPVLTLVREAIHTTGWNTLGRWTRELPEDSRLSVQAYVDYAYRDQQLIADTRTSFDLDAQYEMPSSGRHKMIVGGRYRLSLDDITSSPFITVADATRDDQILSAFVQDKITLADDWHLTLGSKFEHNDYSGFEVQPNARLQWHIDDEQMAWASVARAVRTPSRLEWDLNITYIVGFFGLPAQERFESEELIAYELGYRRQITPAVSVDVAGFYNDYDKLGTVDVSAGAFPITVAFGNSAKGETYGGEVSVNWRAHERLNFSAAYSYLDIQLHGPSTSIDPETGEGQSPEQQLNLRSMWNIRDNLTFDTTVYYVDPLPNYGIDAYWRLDVNLGWKIAEGLEFNLVGQDLFSSANREFGSPTDPFTPVTRIEPSVYGKFTWTF